MSHDHWQTPVREMAAGIRRRVDRIDGHDMETLADLGKEETGHPIPYRHLFFVIPIPVGE